MIQVYLKPLWRESLIDYVGKKMGQPNAHVIDVMEQPNVNLIDVIQAVWTVVHLHKLPLQFTSVLQW